MELPSLITAAQRGDIDAFGTLVERFQRMAYALAYGVVGDAHLAEDAAQEAFIDAFLHLPQLREPAAFVAWLRRIVFKHADRLVRGKRLQTADLAGEADAVPAQDDPAALAADRELGGRVRAAIAELPEHQRLVVSLFYLADLSHSAIAAALDLPAGTVKKRLHDARAQLRRRMEPMARDYLARQQPNDQFPMTIQFLITVRTRNLPKIRELLARDPGLVPAREDGDAAAARHYLPLSGGATALHRAAADGDIGLMTLLLDAGADPNAASKFGLTPLHSAIESLRNEAVLLLLERGADPRPALRTGLTPLHWAAMRGDREIVAALLRCGADPAATDRYGRTPADWAALKGYQDLNDLLASR